MKIKRDDTIMVMAGRDKGKTGKVTAVIPAKNMILVENINVVKRHTKPSDKNPRGGILDLVKPIDVSKVMVVDPSTNLPARIGYRFNANGEKERIFKVSSQRQAAKSKKKPEDKKADDTKLEAGSLKPEGKADDKPKTVTKSKTSAKTEGGAK